MKCPGSGMAEKNLWSNLDLLTHPDEVKFVIADRKDFDVGQGDRIPVQASQQRTHVLYSPVFGMLSPTDLAGWMLEAGVQGRLQIQLHKYLWDPQRRGV